MTRRECLRWIVVALIALTAQRIEARAGEEGGGDSKPSPAGKPLPGHAKRISFVNMTGDGDRTCLLFYAQLSLVVLVKDTNAPTGVSTYALSIDGSDLTYSGVCGSSEPNPTLTLTSKKGSIGNSSAGIQLKGFSFTMKFRSENPLVKGRRNNDVAWYVDQNASDTLVFSANGTVYHGGKDIQFTMGTPLRACSKTDVEAEAAYSFSCASPSVFWAVPPAKAKKPDGSITAPSPFSCYSRPIGDVAGIGLRFRDLQVQPFGVHNGRFSDASDCVPFFSMGILMGWFCGIVLLLVFSFGVTMISQLRTMDRFDDPRGKPIAINVKE